MLEKIVDITSLEHTIESEWAGIKANAMSIMERIHIIGCALIEASNILPHGRYERWVREKFDPIGMSFETATNFRRVAERFTMQDLQEHPHVQQSVWYLMSRKSTSDAVLDEIKRIASNGSGISYDQAQKIARADKYVKEHAPLEIIQDVQSAQITVIEAEHLTKALLASTPEVQTAVAVHKVRDPKVVHLLNDMQRRMPEEFDSVRVTGYIQSEEPISISSVNYREVQGYMDQVRREQNFVAYEESKVLDGTAKIKVIDGNTITLEFDQPVPDALRFLDEVRVVLRVRS